MLESKLNILYLVLTDPFHTIKLAKLSKRAKEHAKLTETNQGSLPPALRLRTQPEPRSRLSLPLKPLPTYSFPIPPCSSSFSHSLANPSPINSCPTTAHSISGSGVVLVRFQHLSVLPYPETLSRPCAIRYIKAYQIDDVLTILFGLRQKKAQHINHPGNPPAVFHCRSTSAFLSRCLR